jgi:hypothetical protein
MKKREFSYPVTTLIGSTVSNFTRVTMGHSIPMKYWHKIGFSFLLSLLFEPFTYWERFRLDRKAAQTPHQEPPVFIIGFWRSGTTCLHQLLCSDPDAAYTTTFQVVFPNLFITQEKWLKKFTSFGLPEKRPFDNVGWTMDTPQEEEFALANIQPHSLYNFFLFPADFDSILEKEFFTGDLPDREKEYWKQSYARMMGKTMVRKSGKRYISKNPCNLGRIGLVLEMFPDAKFIFIHRDPYHVVESFYQFYLSVINGVRVQDIAPGFSRKNILELYCKSLRTYFSVRETIPARNLVEIRMDDFVKDKIGTAEGIYETFGLGNFEKARPFLEKRAEQDRLSDRLHYEIPPETVGLVNAYAADILEKLRYGKITQ